MRSARASERLSTGICSRTRSIDESEEDLAYLRGVPDRPAGEIVGTVLHIEPGTRTRQGTQRPVSGVRVSVTGDGAGGEAVSDENGKFTIAGLSTGVYDASVDAPEGSYGQVHTLAGANRVRLRDVRGCAEADVVLMYDGRIRGRVVLANGAPASHVFVEAVAEENLAEPGLSRWNALTDAAGVFEIAHLPPARYVVGLHVTRPFQGPSLPRAFIAQPDKPLWERPFAVRAGERIVVPELVLPPTLSFTMVEGVVVGTDGQPSADATVYLHLPRLQGVRLGEPVRVDATGKFRFGVLRGYLYSVEASRIVPRGEAMVRGERANHSFDVPLEGQLPVLKLTLRPIAP